MTASPKKNIEEEIAKFESVLIKAGFQWTKCIALYDYCGAKWSWNTGNVQFKLTSGLWIDYESKRIAIRNTKLKTASGQIINDWAVGLGKKKAEEETPEIFCFAEIQDYEVLEGTKTKITGTAFGGINAIDYSDGLSIRIVTGGNYGMSSFQVHLLEKAGAVASMGAGKLSQDSPNYQSCLNCITAMTDELNNIMRMTQPTTKSIVVQQSSNADELAKFKKLFDDGIITQEEFDTKKKQLLGL
jgi:hypothetical protein